jgi:hypothetical protein
MVAWSVTSDLNNRSFFRDTPSTMACLFPHVSVKLQPADVSSLRHFFIFAPTSLCFCFWNFVLFGFIRSSLVTKSIWFAAHSHFGFLPSFLYFDMLFSIPSIANGDWRETLDVTVYPVRWFDASIASMH